MKILLILVSALLLSACSVTQKPQTTFEMKDSAGIEGKIHTYWVSSSEESSLFVTFGGKELELLCREATASGGAQ